VIRDLPNLSGVALLSRGDVAMIVSPSSLCPSNETHGPTHRVEAAE